MIISLKIGLYPEKYGSPIVGFHMSVSHGLKGTKSFIRVVCKTLSGFPAGFHLLGGGEGLWGGVAYIGVGGLRVIKNKVSKKIWGGSN